MSDTQGSGDPQWRPRANTRTTGRTLALAVTAVLLTLVGIAAVTLTSRDPGTAVTPPGQGLPAIPLDDRPAPSQRFELPLQTLEGFGGRDDIALDRLLGQPLVINFWATWCAPCVREMPALQRVARQLEGQVEFLGINVMDAPTNAEEFAADLGIEYALASDPRGGYWKATRSFGMPTTLLVAADGTVVYRHTGELEEDQLRALIDDHLDVTTQ